MLSVLRSTSVRLALGYAVLFVVSSLLLVGLLWWRMAGYLERKTVAVIRADTQAITDDFRFEGVPGAIEMINERLGQVADGSAVYLLADTGRKPIAGNLRSWPPGVDTKPGWYELPLFVDNRVRVMRIEEVSLPDGFHLLVGRDVRDQAEIRALIIDGLSWAAVSAVVLAAAGGVLVRRAVLRRVDIINRTTSAIVRGDLARRLPTRGTTDELDQLSQTINSMLQQIQDLIEGIRNTSNAVAHDLRTPLAELRAQLEGMVLSGASREVMLDGVQKALADIDRVIGIFNALLRLAEIDSGLRRSGFRRVDLAELATEVAELYGPLIEEKQASLMLDAPSGLAVQGDPYLLAQAVGNLVDNAVKYAPRHGMISLRVSRSENGQIEIKVADDGPGIVDDEKTRVTQRFYRGRNCAESAGIGLGLSVVDAVARLHEGSLSLADNHPGLIASLTLPAAPPEASALRADFMEDQHAVGWDAPGLRISEIDRGPVDRRSRGNPSPR
jgi:signal transduction histidine kinase